VLRGRLIALAITLRIAVAAATYAWHRSATSSRRLDDATIRPPSPSWHVAAAVGGIDVAS
jgi:hypothetical protein